MRRPSNISTHAFTLIEVLVVTAVIGVLTSILLPVLGQVRCLGKRTQCSGNLRQIALAWTLYLDDHQSQFYQAINANLWYGGLYSLSECDLDEPTTRPLNPYVDLPTVVTNPDDAEIFRCPADRGGASNSCSLLEIYRYWGTSYQTNQFLIGQNAFDPLSEHTREFDIELSSRISRMSLGKITVPASQLVLIGDYGWIEQWEPQKHKSPWHKEQLEWHHKPDYYNLAFLDGHVAYTPLSKGSYVTHDYMVVPFADMIGWASDIQGPEE